MIPEGTRLRGLVAILGPSPLAFSTDSYLSNKPHNIIKEYKLRHMDLVSTCCFVRASPDPRFGRRFCNLPTRTSLDYQVCAPNFIGRTPPQIRSAGSDFGALSRRNFRTLCITYTYVCIPALCALERLESEVALGSYGRSHWVYLLVKREVFGGLPINTIQPRNRHIRMGGSLRGTLLCWGVGTGTPTSNRIEPDIRRGHETELGQVECRSRSSKRGLRFMRLLGLAFSK